MQNSQLSWISTVSCRTQNYRTCSTKRTQNLLGEQDVLTWKVRSLTHQHHSWRHWTVHDKCHVLRITRTSCSEEEGNILCWRGRGKHWGRGGNGTRLQRMRRSWKGMTKRKAWGGLADTQNMAEKLDYKWPLVWGKGILQFILVRTVFYLGSYHISDYSTMPSTQ